MKYNRFEELPVWQDAIELAVKIFELTGQTRIQTPVQIKRSDRECKYFDL